MGPVALELSAQAGHTLPGPVGSSLKGWPDPQLTRCGLRATEKGLRKISVNG